MLQIESTTPAVADIEEIGNTTSSKSTSMVTVSRKRPREDNSSTQSVDQRKSWREQLGPVPSMGSTKVCLHYHLIASG